MRINIVEYVLLPCTVYILLGFRFLSAFNYNQSEQETGVVKDFNQLFQLWRNDVYSPTNTELVQLVMSNPEELRMTLSNFTSAMLASNLQFGHIFRGIRRYDDPELISKAGNKEVNQTLCSEQLEELVKRAIKQQEDGFNSTDTDLFKLMDTFGRMPGGITQMDSIWPGNYRECLKQNIRVGEVKTRFRYCVGSIKFKQWPQTRLTEHYTYESGICLPKACDSLDSGRKFELVQTLIKLNSWRLIEDEIELSNLYCLPDESSFYLAWWLNPKTCIFILVLLLWISAQLYATFVLGNGRVKRDMNSSWSRIVDSLDIRRNFANLFGSKNMKNTQTPTAQSVTVNLDISNGIKVICLFLVTMGHFLMLSIPSMKNTINFSSITPGTYLFTLINEPPAFFISIFFLLSGIIISYQTFHTQQADSIALSPGGWFDLILKRYIRLVPIYAFMVGYCKYMAKYMGSGPFWDYGTSQLSPRKHCEQESWWYTLTFTSNLKPMQSSCVMPGWYVASDMQFMVLSPIFITGLARHPKVTKILIYMTMLLSCASSGVVNYLSDIPDFTPVYEINMFSNGFSIIFMNEVYTRPQYRITAFLVGILVGHYLYERKNAKPQHSPGTAETTGRSWMNLLRRYEKIYSAFVLVSILSILHMGMITKLSPFHGKLAARIVVSVLFPLLLSFASVIVAPYIILASEGRGCRTVNKLLSSSFWVPLAKISLTVLVCHCEVLIFIMQSITLPMYLELFTHLSFIILGILATYAVSIVLFLFIEAPSAQLLKILIVAKL